MSRLDEFKRVLDAAIGRCTSRIGALVAAGMVEIGSRWVLFVVGCGAFFFAQMDTHRSEKRLRH